MRAKWPIAVTCAAALAAGSGAAAAAPALKGVWVATGPFGKITLRLQGAGKSYHGTYTLAPRAHAAGKPAKVVAHLDNADGATQITLTFTATRRSSLCGLEGVKLYCQLASGTVVFARA